ncbi:hypothetical protein EVAR_97562_1 [Eumeta japonica]|uniref:Uncharacterized protein n=1 Tax=Eumeta variegata TaxID=151549 RepID=A0A4C1WRN3_EUMVA|nr:hypothetical protein EVAR_97562_1 [Eumeta japonica]
MLHSASFVLLHYPSTALSPQSTIVQSYGSAALRLYRHLIALSPVRVSPGFTAVNSTRTSTDRYHQHIRGSKCSARHGENWFH